MEFRPFYDLGVNRCAEGACESENGIVGLSKIAACQ